VELAKDMLKGNVLEFMDIEYSISPVLKADQQHLLFIVLNIHYLLLELTVSDESMYS
jgi:hypothetical protein